jgi:hypothetical protein
MSTRARVIGLFCALLALVLVTPLSTFAATTGPWAPTGTADSVSPEPVAEPPADAPCVLHAQNDAFIVPAVVPSALDVLGNDCPGSASVSRPMTIVSVTKPDHGGSASTDGRTLFYEPSACYAGVETLSYTVTDDGTRTSTAVVFLTVKRPATAPVTNTPTASLVRGSIMATASSTSTVPLKVAWCGVTASGASVKSYRLVQSTNGGVTYPSVITNATTSLSTTRNAAVSTSYAWEVRTTDSKSRTGDYATTPTSRISRYQESSSIIKYSSGWSTSSSSHYSGGKERAVAHTSATATMTVTNVRQFAIVASTAPGRGSFHVWVDGKRVTSTAISQRSSSTVYRKVLYVGSVTGGAGVKHDIQVKTVNSARVDLDAILTLSGKRDAVITFTPPTAPTTAIVNGTPDAIAATSSSGLPVALRVSQASWPVCSLIAGVVSYHGRGTCSVIATQPGDALWNANVTPLPITVAGLPQAITFDPLGDRTYGDPDLTVSATADSGLPVAFGSKTPLICSAAGDTVSILAAGTCTITASQPGDATRAPAAPVDQSFAVAKVGLTVTGVTATGRQYDGTTVATLDTTNAQLVGILGADDVTVVTTGATGAFADPNVGVAKPVTISGLTLAGAKAGDYALTQPSATATITKADQAITVTTTAPVFPVKDGPSYTPAATADSGLPVTITVVPTPAGICTIAGGVISFPDSGTCVVNFDQAGNGNWSPAPQEVQTLTVASTGTTPQTIAFTAPGTATYGDPNVPLVASATSGLTVTLVSQDAEICEVSGTDAVIKGAGACHIVATQAGDPTYAAAPDVTRTLTVDPRAITVTAAAATKVYDGDVTSAGVPTVTAGSLAAGDTGTWTQTYDTRTVGSGKTLTPAGTVHHGPTDATADYAITFTPVTTGVINPGSATHLVLTGFPTTTAAGTSHTMTVTAEDAFGNTATGYTGTVHFTSTDVQAVLPVNYVFLVGDAGDHTFTNALSLKTAATQSITVTDTVTGTITGSQSGITVTPAGAANLVVAATTPQTAGTPFSVTVTAKDAFNNTATAYTGIVHFTSNDPGADSLPGNYTFTGPDNGVHVFSNGVTLVTAGSRTVTATDTVNGAITGLTGTISVTPEVASIFTVVAGNTQNSAVPFTVTVTAKDAFGNTATGYRGTAHFTSNDGAATLPADYAFTGGDSGVHAFNNGVTLETAQTTTITATDTIDALVTGSSAPITVGAGAATHLVLTGFPTTTAAGASHTLTVTAEDAFGNPAAGYRGTVHFTSSDGQAVLPANYTFVSGDGGAHTFANALTLKTTPTQSITATDIVTGSITGTQAGITVTPLAAVDLTVTGYPSPTIAGAAHNVTITAKDAFGNVATAYTGTVHVTSSDASAVLPPNYTFTGGDAGVHNLSVTLKTGPTQSITVTDTGNGTISGSQGSITVGAAAAASYTVTATTTQVSGTPFTVSVAVKDGFGNTVTTYAGTIHFTSTDGAAGLPADYTFVLGDAGSHTFNGVTLATVGAQTITATETPGAAISGTSGSITVNAGAAMHFTVSGYVASTVAGASHNVTVTAKDAAGNTVTTYPGTVHITSSDGQAQLPLNNTLSSGTRTFAVALGTVGTQTITATDTVNGSITGSQAGITVTEGAATHFIVSGYPASTIAGTSHNVTVTAKDAFGNTATAYAGTVHFSSTDGAAVLPANTTLTAGTGTFAATLRTAPTQSIVATDTVTGSITGSQAGITVTPETAATLVVTASTPQTAGATFTVTVTAKDAFDNTATGYTGTVQLTSSDGAAILPANHPFTGGEAGVHAFTGVTLVTAGSSTVTATDTGNGTITGATGPITVNPGALDHIVISPSSATITAGGSQAYTAQAFDALDNSRGDVTSATTFTVTPDGSCTLASCTASIAGPHTVQGSNGGKTDTASLTVNPGPASAAGSTISASPTTLQGDGVTTSVITVQLRDQFGNAIGTSAGAVALGVQLGGAGGTIDPAVDQGDGTWTATYTSVLVVAPDQDTITGELNGVPIADTATISLTP